MGTGRGGRKVAAGGGAAAGALVLVGGAAAAATKEQQQAALDRKAETLQGQIKAATIAAEQARVRGASAAEVAEKRAAELRLRARLEREVLAAKAKVASGNPKAGAQERGRAAELTARAFAQEKIARAERQFANDPSRKADVIRQIRNQERRRLDAVLTATTKATKTEKSARTSILKALARKKVSGKDWAALGISPTKNEAAVRAAYRASISKVHPDRPGGSEAKAASVQTAFNKIGTAMGWIKPMSVEKSAGTPKAPREKRAKKGVPLSSQIEFADVGFAPKAQGTAKKKKGA